MFACLSANAQPATPVVLISVDTLRADHLGCYRAGKVQTPHIDSLAKKGTLFSELSSPYPLTLPSHVALFTSTYTFANGVQDNGIPLKPPAATLATILKSAGYRTAAFVGSFVLDRRFGLSRGFDVYDEPSDLHKETTTGAVERKRPGAQVAATAMQWLERNGNAPFFLFLHLYDLHAPYDLPEDPRLRQGEAGYGAELAYLDRVLGDFLGFLDHRGLLEKSLIVFTSDHGEGLGDHGESTHGYFVYQSTLHVPLIIHWPATSSRRMPESVNEPAGLLDVAPTILEAIGLPRPGGMRGRSLIGAANAEEIYSESLYARNHFGCAVLRTLRVGRYKYIDAPKPELYDLASDPNERNNLYESERPTATELSRRVAAIRASAPSHGEKPAGPTPETASALRSLGYLSGSANSTRASPNVDPKDRISDFERFHTALSLASSGRLAESNGLLESLRDRLPDVADICINLGLNRQRAGDFGQAAGEFKRVLEREPDNAQSHFELGFSDYRLGQSQEAIRELKGALALEPWYTRADELLAEIYIQQKDFAQAHNHLNHLLSIDPHNYTAHYNLGIFAAMEKNWGEAQSQMSAALKTDPDSAEAHNTLGSIYLQIGDLAKAQRQFEDAIRLETTLASAHYNLGLVFQKQGKQEQAGREFRAALEADQRPSH
jgi:arylsulfatase A-like enzyme/tetratricopeptide (TPR) repeat protein